MQPQIPEKSFYQENNLLQLEVPNGMYEFQKITTTSERPSNLLLELSQYQEKPERQYHQVMLGGATWTYVVDTWHKDRIVRNVQEIVITQENGKHLNVHDLMKSLGISTLLMTGVDPHSDNESRDEYSADQNLEFGVGHAKIPIPRTAQDVLAAIHELAHLVLDTKLKNKLNLYSQEYYLGGDFVSTEAEWEKLYNATKSRYEMATNITDKELIKVAGDKILAEYRASPFYRQSKLGEARLEFDTWFVAIQMAPLFGLEEFMKRHSKHLPDLINYYAFTTRLTNLK